jgi:hypothetical protein
VTPPASGVPSGPVTASGSASRRSSTVSAAPSAGDPAGRAARVGAAWRRRRCG